MKYFTARRDDMVDALNEIGTWPAKEHVKRMQTLWPARNSTGREPCYLNLNDDDPLVKPLTTALVVLKLES